MRQCTTGRAGAVCAGQVERLHRRALGQPVAFAGGNAHRARRVDQPGADGGPAHRHQLQRIGGALAGLRQVARPGAQHLRQQDHAVGPVIGHHRLKARGVETRRTGESDLPQRQRHAGRAAGQRSHQAGDVLEQHREGQGAQVAADAQRLRGLHQPVGHAAHRLRSQANALRRAGGARGVGDLGGAGRHRRALGRQAQQGQHAAGHVDTLQRRLRPLLGAARCRQHGVDPGGAQGMPDLLRREERRQRHVHEIRLRSRQIGHHPRG